VEALPWFWIWIVLAAALCVGEMLTMSFFMLPFAAGAAVAAVACVLGAPLWLQFALLIAVSIIALAVLRPLASRITKNNVEKAGVDRLIGSTGVVIASGVDAAAAAGAVATAAAGAVADTATDASPAGAARDKQEFRVLVQRDEWNALSDDGAVLPADTRVEVLRVEGTHLIVKPVGQQQPAVATQPADQPQPTAATQPSGSQAAAQQQPANAQPAAPATPQS
jgi:membrane protein implicated in regulation of membrane protease activity